MIAQLFGAEIQSARRLIEQNGLSFEDGFDAMYGIHEDGELIAVGARAGNVLKMVAIEASHQGGSLLGEIVTALVASGLAAGFDSLFVFTKVEYARSFQALNFTLLANQGRVVLLEYGKGLANWLASNQALRREGLNGAVVVNCNPFTNGHRFLIESAAQQVDHLYVFVVKEERSIFPFAARYRLVQEGVRDLGKVIVLDTSRYIVSGATFPTYFLKKNDPVAQIQMELDVTLFASKIAPFFGITRRFVGTEPNCQLTDAYNATMRQLLPVHGVELIMIERKHAADAAISASRVRELLAHDDRERLAEYVPATTLAYLQGDEAAPIREQLQR
ncbi:MAG: [citrate (pro-3S)-lyase] ligase, partial [Propionivibrio sp.]